MSFKFGLNSFLYAPAYDCSPVECALALGQPGGWYVSTDFKGYFNQIAVAEEFKKFLGVVGPNGELARYNFIPFGIRPASHIANFLTAEVCMHADINGHPNAFIIDDCLFGPYKDEAAAEVASRFILAIFARAGFVVNLTKLRISQTPVFYGFIFDFARKLLTFQPKSLLSTILQLQKLKASLSEELVDRVKYNPKDLESLVGRLGHQSSVVQAGRCHLPSLRALAKWGHNLSPTGLRIAQEDVDWFLFRLKAIYADEEADGQFPILMGDDYANMILQAQVVLADATCGDENGFGYIQGSLASTQDHARFVSMYEQQKMDSSQAGELMQFRHALAQTDVTGTLFILITDSQAAESAINKGSSNKGSHIILREIFDIADSKQITLIALSIPRELNQLADFLSHLHTHLHSRLVQGTLAELDRLPGGQAALSQHAAQTRRGSALRALDSILSEARARRTFTTYR